MVPDELIGNLGDTHLYLDHIDQAKEQLTREPMPLSNLNINTEFWLTEGGECGEGLLDAVAVFKGFKDDNFCRCLLEEDIQLGNYQSHSAIKAPIFCTPNAYFIVSAAPSVSAANPGIDSNF